MKFRIRKFLTISILFSMFSGYINGMENGITHKAWNFICNSELSPDKDKIDVIFVDKKNCKYLDFWRLYGLPEEANEIFSLFKKLNFKLLTTDSAYFGGGSCVRCNAKISNPKENSRKEEESFLFKQCGCKLCFGCGTSMNNFSDHKCSHGNTLEDSEKKCISMIKSKYNYANCLKSSCYDVFKKDSKKNSSKQCLNQSREDFIKARHEFLISTKRETTKKKIRHDVENEECLDTADKTINSMFDGVALDIINSAKVYFKDKDAELGVGCPICCEDTHSVCLPQCGHPICLNCLKDLANKKNNYCPICKSKFYRIIVLREYMDDGTLNQFSDKNKDWIQQAIKE